jgi:hypothetical protein
MVRAAPPALAEVGVTLVTVGAVFVVCGAAGGVDPLPQPAMANEIKADTLNVKRRFITGS